MRLLVAASLAIVAASGCCDRNCISGDGVADDLDAPEGSDSSGDASTDSEDGTDCVPSGAGEAPYTDLEACIRAASCAHPALLDALDPVEMCLARSVLQETTQRFGEYEALLAAGLVEAFLGEINDNASCLAAATTCDEALRCLNRGGDSASCTTPAPDIPAWGQGCTGSVLGVCLVTVAGTTSGTTFLHDCAEEGRICVSTPAMAGCMETDCAAASGPACAGSVIDHCLQPGAHVAVDCEDLAGGTGGACGDADPVQSGIQVGCVPPGGPCDPSSDAPYCDGEILSTCDPAFSRWTSVDCSEIQDEWSCQVAGGGARCMPDSTGCTLALDPACDCDDVVVCDPQSGRDTRIHCPDFGYTTCEAASCT